MSKVGFTSKLSFTGNVNVISLAYSCLVEGQRLFVLLGESQGGLTAGDVQGLAHASLRVAQKRLKELYDAGIVTRAKEGPSFVYSLAN